jgi:hypothetical protein
MWSKGRCNTGQDFLPVSLKLHHGSICYLECLQENRGISRYEGNYKLRVEEAKNSKMGHIKFVRFMFLLRSEQLPNRQILWTINISQRRQVYK